MLISIIPLKNQGNKSSLAAQWVEDPVLSQQQVQVAVVVWVGSLAWEFLHAKDEEKKKKVFLVLNFCHFAGIIAKGTHLSNVNFLKLLSNILIKQS